MMMEQLLYGYGGITILVCAYMLHLIARITRSGIDYKKYLILPIVAGVSALLAYAAFLFSSYYITAKIFYGLYVIGMDWFAYAMFNFAIAYTKTAINKKIADRVFLTFLILDSISFIVNIFTSHGFDLVQMYTSSGLIYWGLKVTFLYHIHVAFCYVVVFSVFGVFAINALIAPLLYKTRYITCLAAYFVVIFSNFISYTLNFPVDVSVVFYGLLLSFISHYSIQAFPNFLVYNVLKRVNDSVADAIVHFDYEGRVLFQNSSAKRMFDERIGLIKTSPEIFRKEFLVNRNPNLDLKVDDRTYHLKIDYQDLSIDDSDVGSYIKISDKTDEVNQFEYERYLATHDSLTGLYNRAGFFEAIVQAIKKKQFKNPIMVCSNIKDFKLINEIFGEAAGDKVLKKQADLMLSLGNSSNLKGRLNDDKFAIFMEKENFDERLFRLGFEALRNIVENSSYKLGLSIGIYEMTNLSESVQLMYDKAKLAMDSIANDYQTLFAYYDSDLMDKLLAEKNIANEFEKALNEGQFEAYVQPIMTRDGKLNRVELFARWNHPKRGIIYPSVFIDVLDKVGLLYKLDMTMCEIAAQKFAEWRKNGKEVDSVSVNFSYKDKYYIDVLEFLRKTARKYDIPADKLMIEFKETALIEDYEAGQNLFREAHKEGYMIAIDSFGSGYSSLNMLKDFDIDAIKIESSFFSEDEMPERSDIILSSMISMAKELDMTVVAKGVETEEQIKVFERLGCEFFQGKFYGDPMNISDFERMYLS